MSKEEFRAAVIQAQKERKIKKKLLEYDTKSYIRARNSQYMHEKQYYR